ncbi:type VI secretion system accessory protein TagJ [Aquabacterium sp.]|uniref:type VI secretion system accessory protein TagJ n=1 Tax=Aquabacterium sp. TaxID=1872578 RepID=UPI0019AD9FA6|nr:type VI secretion system accessory protein TagJ [Aquabacterium sp.]MBC7699596.1 tetratricopeptide repeat protein [Aquabacterium sp.]
MNAPSTALSAPEDSLRAGDPQQALKQLQDLIRGKPGDAKLRVFLFQLLCVLGQWERALNQLNVATELDASTLAMAQTYREGIKCELLRAEVFKGLKVPMIFGQPEPWLALLIEALLREGKGEHADAKSLRDQAFEQAPAVSGTVGQGDAAQAFEWIADADMRLGPVIEAVINGKYYWVPFSRLSALTIDPPEDLRDAVWMPAHFVFENGGESVGLIPTRYAGSEASLDGLIALSRKTDWVESTPGFYTGLGQRLFTTNEGDTPLMDLRSITFNATPSDATDTAAAAE